MLYNDKIINRLFVNSSDHFDAQYAKLLFQLGTDDRRKVKQNLLSLGASLRVIVPQRIFVMDLKNLEKLTGIWIDKIYINQANAKTINLSLC